VRSVRSAGAGGDEPMGSRAATGCLTFQQFVDRLQVEPRVKERQPDRSARCLYELLRESGARIEQREDGRCCRRATAL
jgi:hypothetical protein